MSEFDVSDHPEAFPALSGFATRAEVEIEYACTRIDCECRALVPTTHEALIEHGAEARTALLPDDWRYELKDRDLVLHCPEHVGT